MSTLKRTAKHDYFDSSL